MSLARRIRGLLGGSSGGGSSRSTNPVAAFAALKEKAPLESYAIQRRTPGTDDVQIDIEFCGICHTDLHFVNNDMQNSVYPMVPGHEIVGRVAKAGSGASAFKAGDRVAVGCLVESCRRCGPCKNHLEQLCQNGYTLTYNAPTSDPGGITYGGYSKSIVVNKDFVLRVPESLDPAGAAPLLCAGITTYSPLKHWRIGSSQTVGVIGLGGLGHMGVKFAHALGAHVVMITTSPEKGADAKALGADEVLVSTDANAMENNAGRFDFLLNTIPVGHDINPYVALLAQEGVMCIVGAVTTLDPVEPAPLMFARKTITGSMIGGIQETQEMLDFCGTHNIMSDVEVIPMQGVNGAYGRMLKNDVKYRFVIDLSSL